MDAAHVETNDQATGFDHLHVELVLVEVVVEGRMDLQELAGGVIAGTGGHVGELSVAFGDGVGKEVIPGYVQGGVRVAPEDPRLDPVGGRGDSGDAPGRGPTRTRCS